MIFLSWKICFGSKQPLAHFEKLLYLFALALKLTKTALLFSPFAPVEGHRAKSRPLTFPLERKKKKCSAPQRIVGRTKNFVSRLPQPPPAGMDAESTIPYDAVDKCWAGFPPPVLKKNELARFSAPLAPGHNATTTQSP